MTHPTQTLTPKTKQLIENARACVERGKASTAVYPPQMIWHWIEAVDEMRRAMEQLEQEDRAPFAMPIIEVARR